MTNKISNIQQDLLAAGCMDSEKSGLITYTWMAKIAPWWLAAGTTFRLKYRDSYRRTAPPTFTPSTAGPLWASQVARNQYFTQDQRNDPATYQTSTLTLKFCIIYRDFARAQKF